MSYFSLLNFITWTFELQLLQCLWRRRKTSKKFCSSEKLTSNLISKTLNECKVIFCLLEDGSDDEISYGVIGSKDDMLEEVLNLRIKLAYSLKRINILENKLQGYENRDHDK